MSKIKMASYGYILIKHKNIYDYGMTTQPNDTFKFYFVN